MLYSSLPSEPTCLSELLMCINTSVLNVCQHNYFSIQHCHFVNNTQISDVIKRLRFGKSAGIDNLYSDNFKHGTDHFFHCISVVINCLFVMDIALCCCYTYSPERETKFVQHMQLSSHCIIEYFLVYL